MQASEKYLIEIYKFNCDAKLFEPTAVAKEAFKKPQFFYDLKSNAKPYQP